MKFEFFIACFSLHYFEKYNSTENNKVKLKLKKAEIVIAEPIAKTESIIVGDTNIYHVDAELTAPLSPSSSVQSSTNGSDNVTQEINLMKLNELDEPKLIDKNNNEEPVSKVTATTTRRNSIGLLLLKNIEASMEKEEINKNSNANIKNNKTTSPSSYFMSRRASFDIKNTKYGENDLLVDSILKFRQMHEANKSKDVMNNSDELKKFQNSSTFMNRRATFDYTGMKASQGENLNEISQRKNNVELNKNIYSPFKTSSLINYAQNESINGEKQKLINVIK